MGNLTMQDFFNELVFDLRNRTDRVTDDGVSDTRLNMWLNSGYLHITHPTVFRHRELKFRSTITLVDADNSYTFTPSGNSPIAAIRFVSHVDAATDDPTAQRTKLIPRDEQWFEDRTLSTGGPPRNYYIRGDQLVIDPVPTSVEAGTILVVGSWREPNPFNINLIDVQVSELGGLWDEIILLAARWRAELHLGYRDLAEATKLDFVSLINEYKDFDQLHAEDWDWITDVRTESYMEST